MKLLKSRWGPVVIALAMTALLAPPVSSVGLLEAKVTSMVGRVQERTIAKPFWHDTVLESRLHAGESLRTGQAARVELTLGDGNITRLGPSTTFYLRQGEQNFLLRLLLGKIYLKFSVPHAILQLETPSMLAAITGTEFLATVNEANVSHVTVLAGKVEVTGDLGDKVTVLPGEWAEIEPHKPVARPTKFGMAKLRRNEPLLRGLGKSKDAAADQAVY